MKQMKNHILTAVLGFMLASLSPLHVLAQSTSPAPYCAGTYGSGNCNQGGPSNTPGNSVNDFIDTFITSGGNTNISNPSSGCNNGPGNFMNYCQHYLQVTPGQVITCTVQSGIIYPQGFAIFVDWNQDNVFGTGEQVAATTGVPPAATPTVLTFTIPATQGPGAYRMRVRCAFATAGTAITPCGAFGFGETEDYTIYIGAIPAGSGVVTATATGNSPLCSGQTLSLSVNSTNSPITYTWTGPNSYVSTQQNPVITGMTPLQAGIYTVVTSGSCPASKTVEVKVAPDPSFSLSPNQVICQGNNTQAGVIFSNPVNPIQFSYNWQATVTPGTFQAGGLGVGLFSPNSQTTTIAPSLITGTSTVIVYTVVVSPTLVSCPITHTMSITINNPLTPQLNLITPLCNTMTPVMLSATPGGGTWTGNPGVAPNGLFTPSLATNQTGTNNVIYSASVGTCIVSNSGTISVSKFNTAALSGTVNMLCSHTDPVFNLMNIVQSTVNGTWSGVGVTNNGFNPTGLASGIYPLTYLTLSTPALNTCSAAAVIPVQVYNPPTPLINPIAPRCNTAGTVQLTSTQTVGLLWTTNPGVSSTGVLSPSNCVLTGNGQQTVLMTAGIGTCTATGPGTFHISKFNTAALTGSVPNLCALNSPANFNLLSISQYTGGVWATSPLSTNTLNVINPSQSFVAGLAGYTLTYNTFATPQTGLNTTVVPPTTITMCPDTRTIAVSVLRPVTPNITQVGPFCTAGAPVQLAVTPTTGAWVATSYLNLNGVFTPSLAPPGNNMVRYVVGTPTCLAQQTKYISIEAFVPATISGTIADQCNNNLPVNLQPYTNNQGSWSGPGILGTSFNPATSGTGTINLTYNTASSPSGLCPDQATVAVHVYSLATPLFSNSGPFCSSAAPVQLGVSPTGGLFGGANTNAIDAQGLFRPASALIGNNIVNYSITSGPCIAYAQTTISVEKFVSAQFASLAGPFCKNDPALRLNLNSLVMNPGGTWGGHGVNANGIFTFADADVNANTLINYMTHSMPTATLCPDVSTLSIRVFDTPQVNIKASQPQGCAPVTINLSPDRNEGSGTWDFGNGQTEQGLGIKRSFDVPGTYNVIFNYSVDVGSGLSCAAQASLAAPIRIFESPKADFELSAQEVMISDPQIQLNNTSTVLGKNKYSWKVFGNGLDTSYTEVNPLLNLPKVGDYKITLAATSLEGCKSEATKYVAVKGEFNVYIPSTFTPNDDKLNDVFMPVFTEYGLDESVYDLQIFDRWGAQVFQTKKRSEGWDGKIKGVNAKQDVYVYKLRFRDINGNVYTKIGHVNVLW